MAPSDVAEIVDAAGSAEAREDMRRVRELDLPEEIAPIVDRYRTFRGSRDVFIWKWVHALNPRFTFPIIRPEHRDRVRNVKTVATLFLTLLDDVLEKERDLATFQEASKAPFPRQETHADAAGVDGGYVAFVQEVWDWIDDQLDRAPRREAFDGLLRYDLKYAIGAIEYSYLVTNQPAVTGIEEHVRREAHNMMMYPYADIDLMFAPELPPRDVSLLRKAVHHAQLMARVGNWVSTWERELGEGDYSAGPIVYALQMGVITRDDLHRIEEDPSGEEHEAVAKRIKNAGIEELFLDRWQDNYEDLWAIRDDFTAVDITPFVEGMCEVLRFHVASTGMK